MIIPARKLTAYQFEFPIQLFCERGIRVVAIIQTREQLIPYLSQEEIVGFGTWRKVRHLRMNHVNDECKVKVSQEPRSRSLLPIAEDNRTVFLDGRTWTHHGQRSAAYSR